MITLNNSLWQKFLKNEIVPVSFISHFTPVPEDLANCFSMSLLVRRIFEIFQELRDFCGFEFRMVPLHVSCRIFIGLTIYVRSSC